MIYILTLTQIAHHWFKIWATDGTKYLHWQNLLPQYCTCNHQNSEQHNKPVQKSSNVDVRWRDKIILFESKASQARLSCVLYFMRLILTYNTRCLDIPLFRPCVASPPAVSAKAILVSLHHCILDFKVKFLIEKASRVTYRGTLL